MFKTLTLTYMTGGRIYNENRVYNFENENLGTLINIAVPESYEDFTFVMDCKNGDITKQIEIGTGDTSYSFSLDNSLTVAGTLELQLWATILSNDETVKVQWEKYNLTIDSALNISEITAESNPDIIATHTAQIADLYNITSILDVTGDGGLFLSDDGTYRTAGSTGTRDYNTITNKPQINSITLEGDKSSEDLGLQPVGDYEPANSNIQSHISDSSIHLTSTEKTNVGKLVSTGDGSKYLGDDGNYTTVSSGTMDYDELSNKPSINSVELSGNKSLGDLGIQPSGSYLTVETDPTVPAWAKNATKPSYAHDEISNLDTPNSHPASAISYNSTNVDDELDARINKTYTLDILTGDWSTNSFTQSITGLTDADYVSVQAIDSYYSDYGLSYTQSGSNITFTVTVTPLITLSVGIAVVKGVSGGAL